MIPAPPDDLLELAEWYALHGVAMEAMARQWRAAKARLLNTVRDTGPILTEHGRVGLAPDGYEWSAEAVEAVAEKMPSLITCAAVTISVPAQPPKGPTAMDVARLCVEAVYEAAPTASIDVSWDTQLDKVQANALIRAGGEAGAFLSGLRKPKNQLRVE